MRTRFVNFVASLSFRRDDIQRLKNNKVFQQISAVGDERVELSPGFLPVQWHGRSRTGVWGAINKTLSAALPQRFAVFVRLRMRDGEELRRGDWESVRAECLVGAVGVIVNLQFGFGEIAREKLVAWPGNGIFCLLDLDRKETWRGSISELCLRTALATLDALGDEWKKLDTSEWPQRIDGALYRIYTEFQAARQEVQTRLMYGLAVNKQGWDRVTAEQLKTTYRRNGLQEGESYCFAKRGCAAVLSALDENAWGQANCRHRNLVYAQALHQIAVDHLGSLIDELNRGAGQSRPELDDITQDDNGDSSVFSQTRFAALLRLYDVNTYSFLKYLARKVRFDQWLNDLGSVPLEARSRIVTPPVLQKLVQHLGGFNDGEKPSPAGPEDEGKKEAL